MPDRERVNVHQRTTRCIGSQWIVGEDDTPEMTSRTMQRPIALHRFHSIRDNAMDGNRRGEFDDGVVDPLPVQDVLRPAVHGAGDNPKEILEAERHAGPVMGLDLGHRDDHIGGK